MKSKNCPKCGVALKKGATMSSGNSKYTDWHCEGCTYKTSECHGPSL